jgi:hypothetical protein
VNLLISKAVGGLDFLKKEPTLDGLEIGFISSIVPTRSFYSSVIVKPPTNLNVFSCFMAPSISLNLVKN